MKSGYLVWKLGGDHILLKWAPCHHSMAHSQFGVGGDRLKVLNVQLQTANRG